MGYTPGYTSAYQTELREIACLYMTIPFHVYVAPAVQLMSCSVTEEQHSTKITRPVCPTAALFNGGRSVPNGGRNFRR